MTIDIAGDRRFFRQACNSHGVQGHATLKSTKSPRRKERDQIGGRSLKVHWEKGKEGAGGAT